MIPKIDPKVKYVGSSYLRGLNVEAMKGLSGAVVVQDNESEPLVVILPYGTYLAMQESLTSGPVTMVDSRIFSPLDHDSPPAMVVDNRPKNAFCRHCGNRYAGPKFATICPECKSGGHTLTPAECPVCGQGGTGAL